MKRLILLFVLFSCMTVYGQFLNTGKYLTEGDSILTFVSRHTSFEIIVMDSTVVDTVILEKQTLGGWAPVGVFSMETGAYVVTMIPGAGVSGKVYYVEKNAVGSFRLSFTDAEEATVAAIRVNVVGK